MEGLTALKMGFEALFSNPLLLAILVFGVFFGMVMGAIPGLTATLAVTMALPFTYTLSPNMGLTLLVAIYVGGIAGGLVAAVLLNIPGSPASLVTCFDGSPMARRGESAKALTLGVFSSLIGGTFSAFALVIIAPKLAKVSLAFGAWEYFALGILGLAIIISIVGAADMLKGLISAIVGIIIAFVGYDPISGVPRLMFNKWQLGSGIDTLPALMGLFAIVEIMRQVPNLHVRAIATNPGRIPLLPKKEWINGKDRLRTFSVGSLIGTFVGILPGIGSTTASMFSYNTCRSLSSYPEKYGTGIDEGVIASETANNAVCGGALIPMLTLGIPGDMVTAILMGGLIMNGLTPGPLLFETQPGIIGIVFVAFIISNFVMYIMEMGLMKFFIKTLSIPMEKLFPTVIVMCVVGTLTVHNRLFDSWMMVLITFVGYLLVMNGFPLAPIVLGYILGPLIEKNFRTGVILSSGNMFGFANSKLALSILIIAAIMLALPYITKALQKRKLAKKKAPPSADA